MICRDREWRECGFADVDVWWSSNSCDPIKLKVVRGFYPNNSLVTFSSTTPLCQGITPSNSKGGLPAPEAGAHAEEGGIRDEIDPSPSRSKSSQDKAEPQTAELTQRPKVVEGRARPGGPTEKEAEQWE